MAEYVICKKSDLQSIADAIKTSTGTSDGLSFPNGFVDTLGQGIGSGVNLDVEITAQENVISSQDSLIASIASALEGKAAGGGSGVEVPLKTIRYEFTVDESGSFGGLGDPWTLSYLTVENNTVIYKCLENPTSGTITVLDNSYIRTYAVGLNDNPNVTATWESGQHMPTIIYDGDLADSLIPIEDIVDNDKLIVEIIF